MVRVCVHTHPDHLLLPLEVDEPAVLPGLPKKSIYFIIYYIVLYYIM